MTQKYGFNVPKILDNHFVFGGLSTLDLTILNSGGQWDKFLPTYEAQNNGYETYGCTIWGTQNVIETLQKFIDKSDHNYSERYNYNIMEINPPGGDIQDVCESIRKYGLVNEAILDTPNTYEEFITPRPMTEEYLDVGSKWLKNWQFNHEWVFDMNASMDVKISAMKKALEYSPLGVSVTAWYEEDGIYIDKGEPNNHWCECYGYYESNGQTFWKIFDSYDNSLKILHPNHHILVAKKIQLKRLEKVSLCNRLKKWYNSLYV